MLTCPNVVYSVTKVQLKHANIFQRFNMASKGSKAENAATEVDTADSRDHQPPSQENLPRYFDSEPSSQPPSYENNNTSKTRTRSEPTSAARIAAIMGRPPTPPAKKRSWADRWRDLLSGDNYGRNLDARRGIEEQSAGLGVGGLQPRESGFGGGRLNVFGSVVTEGKKRPPPRIDDK